MDIVTINPQHTFMRTKDSRYPAIDRIFLKEHMHDNDKRLITPELKKKKRTAAHLISRREIDHVLWQIRIMLVLIKYRCFFNSHPSMNIFEIISKKEKEVTPTIQLRSSSMLLL